MVIEQNKINSKLFQVYRSELEVNKSELNTWSE